MSDNTQPQMNPPEQKVIARNYLRITCPDCGTVCRVRTSTEIDPLLRRAYVMCQNIMCGYRGTISVEHVSRLGITGNEKDKRLPYEANVLRHAQMSLIPKGEKE